MKINLGTAFVGALILHLALIGILASNISLDKPEKPEKGAPERRAWGAPARRCCVAAPAGSTEINADGCGGRSSKPRPCGGACSAASRRTALSIRRKLSSAP